MLVLVGQGRRLLRAGVSRFWGQVSWGRRLLLLLLVIEEHRTWVVRGFNKRGLVMQLLARGQLLMLMLLQLLLLVGAAVSGGGHLRVLAGQQVASRAARAPLMGSQVFT